MSATDKFIKTCKMFEEGIKEATLELASVKIRALSSQEVLSKRLQDLALFSSKKKLLQAHTLSLTTEIVDQPKSSDLLLKYGEVASDKVLERCIVNSILQNDAVKKLILTPDSHLNNEMIVKKQQVLKAITEYIGKEKLLYTTDKVLKEKEAELVQVQNLWCEKLKEMRELRDCSMQNEDDEEMEDEEIKKQESMCEKKLRLMCSVAPRLITGPANNYDWLSDPHGRLAALKAFRKCTNELLN